MGIVADTIAGTARVAPAGFARRRSTAFDRLLGSLAPLHEAPDDASAWQTALHGLARAVPCDQGALVERLGGAANAGFGLTVGIDPEFVREYAQEFHRCDPFAGDDAIRAQIRSGRSMLSHEVLAGRALTDTEYYVRFLRRYGVLLHGLGGAFSVSGGGHAHVWLLREHGREFDADERRCVDVFMSHARAALRLRRRLARVERERDNALALIDAGCDPMLVLDDRGRVLLANPPAEALLRDGEVLSLRGEVVRAGRLLETDWMAPALREALVASRRRGGTDAVCIAVPGQPAPPAVYMVLAPLSVQPGQVRVALIVRDLRRMSPRFDAGQLQRLFGFTRTEARVANALLTGSGCEDIAVAWNVRSDTVRAHVKRMLAKTGTRNQGDLQKFLLRLLPNLQALCREDEALDH
ncbi:helix-turn-helix transcriptional regulator [Chiayiivirga flava]|uniref:DNA-binding CsgD family transcriptional regulator n=1 Tax=Chiayiivirga flava TaxID=659595 RepID=A0A7W8D4J7_9GAMM|nr:helix-turn-helix transcriptional regulator [Chiayiivirga flava]MBB5207402.1 DNA-binding CsgD family transcriptional regulator [Chiayiivirga flava]